MERDTIERELRALRTSHRRLRLWCAALSALLAAACLSASSAPAPEVVRARRFELVDAGGELVGWMRAEDGAAGLMLLERPTPDSLRFVALGTGAAGAPDFGTDDGGTVTFGARGGPTHATLSVGGTTPDGSSYASLVASPAYTGLACTGAIIDARAFVGVEREGDGELAGVLHLAGEGEEVATVHALASGSAGARVELEREGSADRRTAWSVGSDGVAILLDHDEGDGGSVVLQDGAALPALLIRDAAGRELFRAPGP